MNSEINEFRIIAQKRWECLEKGDSKGGNVCHTKLAKICKELKNKDKLIELEVLLEDSDDGVKLEAATELLALNLKSAEEVLFKIAEKKGILPFTARQTLKKWNMCK